MSLASHTVSASTGQRISYSKANDFLKLLDNERPAHELSDVLRPGTYHIGWGNGIIQWNGKTAYHAPPNGDIETYDYLKGSKVSVVSSTAPSRGDQCGRNAMGGLLHDVAKLQNGRSGGLQSSVERSQREEPAEMDSPWSRGWAEAERQERL